MVTSKSNLIVFIYLGILLTMLAVPKLALGFGAVGFPEEMPATVDWNPRERAETLAANLLNARNADEVNQLLHEILELIGVGVYDVYGTPIHVGTETSEDDVFLYDYETRLVADGFIKQNYLSLDAIVKSWQSMEIPIVPSGEFIPKLVTSEEIEKTLRDLRKAAQNNTQHPGGFWIRLFDELGDREELPFNLLEEEEEPDFTLAAPGLQAIIEEELNIIRKEAIADGDREMLERLEMLESEAGMQALMEAMAAGDIFLVMQLISGEVEMQELAQYMREVEQELRFDDEAPSHLVDMTQSFSRFFNRQDVELGEIPFDFFRGEIDHYTELRNEIMQELGESLREEYEDLRKRSVLRYASNKYGVDSTMATGSNLIYEQEALIEDNVYLLERYEEEYKIAKEMTDALESKFGKFVLDLDEEESSLHLDPIQNLLLHLDMFLEPREFMSSPMEGLWGRVVNWFNTYVHAQETGGRIVGSLNNILSTANSVKGVIRDIRNIGLERSYAGAVKSIVRGAIQTAATELHIEVYYHDGGSIEQGGSADPQAYIHMRHGEQLRDKRIQIQARIESPFLEALAEQLNQIEPHRDIYGPFQSFMELPDPLGDFHDLADFDYKDVPVRFQPDGEFLFEYLMFDGDHDWDALRGTTFTKNTDEHGVADGYFYVGREEADIGGFLIIAEGNVRVQAMVNASEASIYNPASWGLAVGEEIFRPVQTYVRVRVQYHKPVQRAGTITLTRQVRHYGDVAAYERSKPDHPDAVALLEGSELDCSGLANLTIRMTNVQMDEEGNISGRYNATASGHWDFDSELYQESPNGFTQTFVNNNGRFRGSAEDQIDGIQFIVNSQGNTYLVWPSTAIAILPSEMTFDGRERISTRKVIVVDNERDEERDSEREDIESTADLEDFVTHYLFNPSRLPQREHYPFSRSFNLEGSANYTQTLPDMNMRATLRLPPPDFFVVIHTSVEWNLTGSL